MKFVIPDTIPRVALVTGGARQRGIAQALLEAGFSVALQCHPGDEMELPDRVFPLSADLADESQTETLPRRAMAALGPVGVLINAANAVQRDSWDDAARATWDMHIETNLRAPFVLIQQFARMLPTRDEGVVINLLDQRLCPQLVSYTLSKAALWTLTQTMALALAPRIRVNGIVPQGAVPLAIAPEVSDPDSLAPISSDRDSTNEIGQAVLAILALESMTGQMIVPDGAPPP